MKHIKLFFIFLLLMTVAATASAQYIHIKLNNGKTYDYDSRDIASFVVNMTPPAKLDNEPDETTETMVEAITVVASAENIYVGSTIKGTSQMSASVSPADATNKEVEWSCSDASIATVDANELVTAKAAGQVIIIATAKDGSGVKGEKLLTVAANSVVATSEPIYGTPTITATYTEIEADGSNDATPTVTYNQTAEVTDTYADGSTQKRSLSNVTIGGTVTYTRKSGTATVGTNGKVTASSSTNTSRHSVAVVTVSVSLNGKTGTKDVTVYQKAYVAPPEKIYYGYGLSLPTTITGANSIDKSSTTQISIATELSHKSKVHWIAYKTATLSKWVDIDNDDLKDLIKTTSIDGYTVKYLQSSSYISNTSNIELT